MAYNFVPISAATDIASTVVYGVQDTLDNYILQDINVTEDVNTVQIPDQQGAIAQIRGFQKHWNISFTAIGNGMTPPASGAGNPISFTTADNKTFRAFIQSCERRATYNDTQKWAVTMEAWEGATVSGDVDHPLGPEESGNNG